MAINAWSKVPTLLPHNSSCSKVQSSTKVHSTVIVVVVIATTIVVIVARAVVGVVVVVG